MSKPNHDHRHHAHSQEASKRGWHKDWRTWLVVSLMLLAMLVYLLTMDDSLVPVDVSPKGQSPPSTETPRY